MKNKIGALAFLLASTLVATSCSSEDVKVKQDENGNSIIYTITVDGEEKNFYADELLKELVDTTTGKVAVYNEVAKQVFTIAAEKIATASDLEEFEETATDKVEEFEENAKSQAKTNGVDYDTYLETALESEGVETLDELHAKYVYEEKKNMLFEDYIEDHYETYLKRYLDLYTPFQVKHILVAANTSDAKFTDGTMTTDNARKLLKIMNRFAQGESFAQIADDTDDTSTKNTGGILPFDQSANYVSEFRFAPYILAVYSETDEAKRVAMAQKLHFIDEDGTAEDLAELKIHDIYKDGIDTISLTDIFELNKEVQPNDKGGHLYYDEKGNRKAGVDVPTYAEQVYPSADIGSDEPGNDLYFDEYELRRNEIFNSTLNTHQVKYIEVGTEDVVAKTTVATKHGNKEVLADDKGNPIYVVYASTGIHFMVNVWGSAVAFDKDAGTYTKEVTDADNFKYFSITGDEKLNNKWEGTYVALNGAKEDEIEDNVEALLGIIESYASPLEQYIFADLVYAENPDITITFSSALGEEIYDDVKKYVEDSIESSGESYVDSFQDSLKTYGLKLQRENEVKPAA